MKTVECAQGDIRWHEARRGIVTASQAHRIISPVRMKPSSQQGRYLAELAAERLLGIGVCDESTKWMERGTALEPAALEYYSQTEGVAVQRIGFALADSGDVGCSPDGLVGEDGGVEAKCLQIGHHFDRLRSGLGSEHRCQIQCCMWVTGRRWWDCCSWSPEWRSSVIRVERDDEFIEALASEVAAFNRELAKFVSNEMALMRPFTRETA